VAQARVNGLRFTNGNYDQWPLDYSSRQKKVISISNIKKLTVSVKILRAGKPIAWVGCLAGLL